MCVQACTHSLWHSNNFWSSISRNTLLIPWKQPVRRKWQRHSQVHVCGGERMKSGKTSVLSLPQPACCDTGSVSRWLRRRALEFLWDSHLAWQDSYLHEPTSPKQDKQTTGGVITGTLIPWGQGSRERRDQRAGEDTAVGTAHLITLPPADREPPVPTAKLGRYLCLHPHEVGVTAPLSLTLGFPKLLSYPPDLEDPSHYQHKKQKRNQRFLLPTVVMAEEPQPVIFQLPLNQTRPIRSSP